MCTYEYPIIGGNLVTIVEYAAYGDAFVLGWIFIDYLANVILDTFVPHPFMALCTLTLVVPITGLPSSIILQTQ